MLRVKAIGPCTIGGFQTLRSGEVCDVPAERRDQVECLRKLGRLELLEIPVAAEPSGKDAPPEASDSTAPAALPEPTEEELALLAELAELEKAETAPPPAEPPAPEVPKRALFVCECGKSAPEHASGKVKLDDSVCGGLKRFMKRAPAAT